MVIYSFSFFGFFLEGRKEGRGIFGRSSEIDGMGYVGIWGGVG